MIRTRSLAGHLLLVLTLGLVVTGLTSAPASAATQKLIQGVVVDQTGRPVDDVTVIARNAEGTAVASALTYASAWEDGPQHGYFWLQVTRGVYTLEISKDGYVPVSLDGIEITRRHPKASLGEVTLEKKKVESTTKAVLRDATISTDEKGKVTVTVTSKETAKPTGEVMIKAGGKTVGSDDLRASDRGQITVVLERLARGSYDLKAHFGGSPYLKESDAKAGTLTVRRPSRHRPLPNALPWVG